MGEAAADRRGRRGSLGLSVHTVREATFDVFRRRGLTTLFSNPGSTEVPFLAGLPDAELVCVEEAGHLVMLERPELVNDHLVELVERAGAAARGSRTARA